MGKTTVDLIYVFYCENRSNMKNQLENDKNKINTHCVSPHSVGISFCFVHGYQYWYMF